MHNNNAAKNLDMITIMDMLEKELLPLGRREDFNFFMVNHVILDGISRLANTDSPDRKDAIDKLRAYAHEKIPSLRACESYQQETRNRRIIMFLNYHGLEQMGQWILRTKSNLT